MTEPTIPVTDYLRLGPEALKEADLIPVALEDLRAEMEAARAYIMPGTEQARALAEAVTLCDLEKVLARSLVLGENTAALTEDDVNEMREKREAIERAIVAFRVARMGVRHG